NQPVCAAGSGGPFNSCSSDADCSQGTTCVNPDGCGSQGSHGVCAFPCNTSTTTTTTSATSSTTTTLLLTSCPAVAPPGDPPNRCAGTDCYCVASCPSNQPVCAAGSG